MRRLATLTVATVTAAALLFASPAAAIEAPVNTWIQCPDGATSTGHLTIDEVGPHGYVGISGHVEPCSVPRPTDVYTVAAYYPNHAEAVTVLWGTHKWYSDYFPDARSLFSERVRVDSYVTAICLVTGSQARTDCYELIMASSGTPTVGAAIPTTDSRVQHAVAVPSPAPKDPPEPPSCGGCW
jgi:hypothetical protein